MAEKLIGPNIDNGIIRAGTRDIHNIVYRMVQGYRYLNGNNNPKKIIVTMVDSVDGVPVEFVKQEVEVKPIVKEVKSAKPK
jgi:hypothetical protein